MEPTDLCSAEPAREEVAACPERKFSNASKNSSARFGSKGQGIPPQGFRPRRHPRPENGQGRGGGPSGARQRMAGEEQDMLYAQDRWSLLLVFQAMDAAGKDGTIKHVMSRVNPQGCEVTSFKQPSAEELSHDFLWRYAKAVPARGTDRDLQPLLLRGSPGRAGASGVAEPAKTAAGICHEEDLGRAARRHRPFRGLSDPAGRHRRSSSSSTCRARNRRSAS